MNEATERDDKRLSRKERERARHREEILDAAERVFVLKGFHHARVEEIAEEAEFSTGTLYNFFANKEDLYQQVMLRIADEFVEVFKRDVLAAPGPVAAISGLVALRMTHYETHRGVFRMVLDQHPGAQWDPEHTAMPESCRELYEWYLGEIARIFERGIADGIFRNADPFYLALCLEGMITAAIAYWVRISPEPAPENRIAKMTETILTALCAA